MAASVFRALQGLRQLSFFGCRVQNPVGSGRKASVTSAVCTRVLILLLRPFSSLKVDFRLSWTLFVNKMVVIFPLIKI